MKDTSGGASRGLAEALESISVEAAKPPPAPNPLQRVINYFKSKASTYTAIADIALNQVAITAESPLSLATAIPFVAGLRLNRAMETLEKVPEGKALVDTLRQSGIQADFKNNFMMVGAYFLSSTGIDKNGVVRDFAENIGLPGFSNQGRLISFMAHELQHLKQQQNGMLRIAISKSVSPVEAVWYDNAIEADAQATATDVAYKLMKAGHPDAWNELQKDRSGPVDYTKAYEAAIEKDPRAAENGYAKRAAFDAWFDAKFKGGMAVRDYYAVQGIRSHVMPADVQYGPPDKLPEGASPVKPLAVEDVQRLDKLSSVPYLHLPDARPLDDPHYRVGKFHPQLSKWLGDKHREYQSKFFSKPAAETASAPAMPSRSAFLPQGDSPNRPEGGMLSAIEPPQQQQPVQQAQAAAPVVRQAARSPGPGMRR